ncbi:MAG: alpha/beta hydrolase [Thermoguttaceae bacterium]
MSDRTNETFVATAETESSAKTSVKTSDSSGAVISAAGTAGVVGKSSKSKEKLQVQLDFARVSHHNSDQHVLFSPMHYEPGYAYPLLIWLHGPGSDERQILRIMPMISIRNFVGISPRGSKLSETDSAESSENVKLGKGAELFRSAIPELMLRLDDENEKIKKKDGYDWFQMEPSISEAEQQVFDCISLAKERCNIADNRIFIVGFDTGGTMALRIAMQFPQYFAGVISLGGRLPVGNLPLSQWNDVRNLPTMLAIGQESHIYSSDDAGSDLKLLHAAGLSVSVRQYSCGQEISPLMLQDVNRWIMERVCEG